MQRWREELTNHPVNATVKSLKSAVETDKTLDDPVFEAERARFLKVVNLIEQVLSGLDPDIAPIDVLTNINSQLRNGALASIQNFSSNGNNNQLVDANNQITTILGYLYQLSSLKFTRSTRRADLDAATSSFEKFARQAESKITEINAVVQGVANHVADKAAEIDKISSTVHVAESIFSEKIADWSNQATEFLTAKDADFSSMLTSAKKAQVDTLAGIKEFSKEQIKEFLDEQERRADDAATESEQRLAHIIADANDKHTKIMEFYELVAHDSVTGGHKSIAEREYKAAQRWRYGTIASVGVTLAWLICSLIFLESNLQPERVFWLSAVKSAAITALLISFSVYASKQANLHRANERRMRSFFLQVQAFDPFVSNLPEESRFEMKKALSERIFGSDDVDTDQGRIDNADFKGMEQFTALLERVLKAAKR